jgi:hypothetical protein
LCSTSGCRRAKKKSAAATARHWTKRGVALLTSLPS